MTLALTTRDSSIVEGFRRTFGREPAFIVRAPGRVNLLGEHTDYNALPVLPMAIERCVVIAGAARDDAAVVLHNAGSFFSRSFRLERHIDPFETGDWGNYAKAAAQGMADYYDAALPKGADLYVDGDIPAGAGLSSSSALVVASALALLAASAREIPFDTLAEILPSAERYVGTLSGGMDQAISLLAQAGHALRIDFAPLRYSPVPLPAGYSFVVCNSLVPAEKSGTARHGYNRRVVECRLASRVLERALTGHVRGSLPALGNVTRLFPQRSLSSLVDDLARLVPAIALELPQIASAAGVSVDTLKASCGIPADQIGPFSILKRARHVLTEAERVEHGVQALRSGGAAAFGNLMDASHRSCRDDYEISCPELEELVALAQDAGALGARLTGAGFGGCTLNLVEDHNVQTFLENVDRRFYRSRSRQARPAADVRFVFTAQAGARTDRLT